jgi:hypothetical protein
MFIGVGVKLNFEHFIADCKQRFPSLESDLNQFMNELTRDNKCDDMDDVIFETYDFLSKQLTTLLKLDSNHLAVYEYGEDPRPLESKDINIILGFHILHNSNNDESTKSVKWTKAIACVEELKPILKQLDISEDQLIITLDRF